MKEVIMKFLPIVISIIVLFIVLIIRKTKTKKDDVILDKILPIINDCIHIALGKIPVEKTGKVIDAIKLTDNILKELAKQANNNNINIDSNLNNVLKEFINIISEQRAKSNVIGEDETLKK